MADETLTKLYEAKPSARQAIDSATGYAVFDNMGVHILLLSTAHRHGVAINQKTGQETFMKMLSGGAGLGVGVELPYNSPDYANRKDCSIGTCG